MGKQELYQALSMADGVAGREKEVRDVLKQYLQPHTLELDEDFFGNFYAKKQNGNARKVMIVAHTDEVGFLVKRITADGFLYFQPLGGWWSHHLLAEKVTISSRKNGKKFRGIIGATPPKNHDSSRTIPIGDLYIDIGAASKEEVAALGISPGDMVTPYTVFEPLAANPELLLGKAWDDRAGCAVMARVLEQVASKTWQEIDIIGVGSSQEEVGTRGSKIAAETIKPDIAIILDVATAKDTPRADNYQNRILGAGPGVVWYDKTAIGDVALASKFIDLAEAHQLPYQHDMLAGGGTDAGSVQLSGNGVQTITLSLGVRYCHTSSSIVHSRDIDSLVNWLLLFLEDLEANGGQLI